MPEPVLPVQQTRLQQSLGGAGTRLQRWAVNPWRRLSLLLIALLLVPGGKKAEPPPLPPPPVTPPAPAATVVPAPAAVVPGTGAALQEAVRQAGKDGIILAAGSIFLAAEVRKLSGVIARRPGVKVSADEAI